VEREQQDTTQSYSLQHVDSSEAIPTKEKKKKIKHKNLHNDD